jgi:hypothetical protein
MTATQAAQTSRTRKALNDERAPRARMRWATKDPNADIDAPPVPTRVRREELTDEIRQQTIETGAGAEQWME